jgi:hypothetical protein
MKHVLFAAVAAFGLAASVPAFAAVISNDRIMTNSTALPQGITLAHGTVIADSAGGGESHDRNGRLSVADSAGGGESHDRNGPGTVA